MAILKAREGSSDTFKPVSMMGVGNASQSQRGLMTTQDKVKVDSIGNLADLLTTAKDSIVNAINELFGRDYIVEQGTSGIWTYRKWNSGIAECWGYASAHTATPTVLMGGYFVTITVPFPSGLFASAPTITSVMGRIGTGLGFGTGAATQNNAQVSIFGNQNSTTSYITNVSAIGRWK